MDIDLNEVFENALEQLKNTQKELFIYKAYCKQLEKINSTQKEELENLKNK